MDPKTVVDACDRMLAIVRELAESCVAEQAEIDARLRALGQPATLGDQLDPKKLR